jgi:hypothetical protein
MKCCAVSSGNWTCWMRGTAHRAEGFNGIGARAMTRCQADAEAAMLYSIQAMNPDDVPDEAPLRGAVTAATRASHEGPVGIQELERASSILPLQLRRVLRLPVSLRQPFVLRMLAGAAARELARASLGIESR